MDKKNLFAVFEGFSQNLMVTLAEIEAIKKQVQDVIEENAALRLENGKLRDRLAELESNTSDKNHLSQRRGHLESVYKDGFHICNYSYGQRRDGDTECLMCDELLYRE